MEENLHYSSEEESFIKDRITRKRSTSLSEAQYPKITGPIRRGSGTIHNESVIMNSKQNTAISPIQCNEIQQPGDQSNSGSCIMTPIKCSGSQLSTQVKKFSF